MRPLPLILLAALLCATPATIHAKAKPKAVPADTTPAAPAPAAPALPDGMELLGRIGDAYRALSSYDYQGTLSVRMTGAGADQALDVPLVLAGDRAGRVHLDIQNPQMGARLLSDGQRITTYVYSLNQYMQQDAPPRADSLGLPSPPPNSPMARYFDARQGVLAATVTGPATLTLEERAVDCWLVRADNVPPQQLASDSTATSVTTFWVDQARGLVLRDSTTVTARNPQTSGTMTMTQVTGYDRARSNGPLADSLFVFTPPAGAQLVKQFGQAETPSPLVGKPAPPFTLKGLKGSTVSLAAYKGRVVLLDFWATWCGPCRIEMPEVEKLYKELKPKGLVVFGVNQGEDVPTVQKFLADKPYTFPILLDTKIEVGGKYQAEAIPTLVVIGKDGKVSSYFRGVRDGDTIREAIAKAGIK
jgi:peroxiredoxin/outer membrane lipoprotein-sorting protein